jgi:hypothetical protein
MGTRVRLSKTPEAYQSSRSSHPEPQYEALLAAGRTRWYPGERVRFYRARGKAYVWLPETSEDTTIDQNRAQSETTSSDGKPHAGATRSARELVGDRRDYYVEHYLNVLVTSYAARLRKAFASEDFEQLFRVEQAGLFDQPVESIEPRWIRCVGDS